MQPVGAHQPFHGAPSSDDAFPVQLTPHFAGPIHPVVVRMHSPDQVRNSASLITRSHVGRFLAA